jgi:hypothetical protein
MKWRQKHGRSFAPPPPTTAVPRSVIFPFPFLPLRFGLPCVRLPPPAPAPPLNPVHPPQPPPLATPRTLDPSLDRWVASSRRCCCHPIDAAVDHAIPVVVLRSLMTPSSADLSIDFITAVVTVDYAIPRRPLALLAPPPPWTRSTTAGSTSRSCALSVAAEVTPIVMIPPSPHFDPCRPLFQSATIEIDGKTSSPPLPSYHLHTAGSKHR